MKQIKPFGSWHSPITADAILANGVNLGDIFLDGEDLYWLEGRPQEKGRNTLIKKDAQNNIQEITVSAFNVRTRVNEYGGGAVLVDNGIVFFVNYSDQRIYRQTDAGKAEALTAPSDLRYADFVLDAPNNRLLAVVEDHSEQGKEPANYIAAIDIASGSVHPLIAGADFYSSPRLSPNGNQLAWLEWNHPNMPWDSSKLYVAPLTELNDRVIVAGGKDESICQPLWSPDGVLHFASDRNNWWNLYSYIPEDGVSTLYATEAEFAYPHWVFGLANYGFSSDAQIVCSYSQNGSWHLAYINRKTREFCPLETPYSNISSLKVHGNNAFFLAGSLSSPTALVQLDLNSKVFTTIKASSQLQIDQGYLSQPQSIAFAGYQDEITYAWLYLPNNCDYQAPLGTLPPLLVKSHGGPTAAASVNLNLRIQYWTSRGFAYLDVNYGGSTGYGRRYRERLKGQWGIVDVEDCIAGARHLVREGMVDPSKLAISGGSAGGYTTLAALTFHDLFKAGASYYGVSDLESLAKDTHKFEARYLDGLIGRYPQELAKYQARSPINFTEKLNCPIIFFQGLQDKVVPPNQAQMMVNAIKAKGLPVAYIAFENEQHGFRSAENIKRAIEGEFYFYGKIFGFEELEEREDIEIVNL